MANGPSRLQEGGLWPRRLSSDPYAFQQTKEMNHRLVIPPFGNSGGAVSTCENMDWFRRKIELTYNGKPVYYLAFSFVRMLMTMGWGVLTVAALCDLCLESRKGGNKFIRC